MNKADVKQHILTKHGKSQLKAVGIKELPDKLNELNDLNVKLNRRFGHRKEA